jgi:peptidoglycan/LPS O-acetylase OafA/YrhL
MASRRPERHLLIRVAGLFRGGPRELAAATERRIPSLDALRSVAVLLVINTHAAGEFSQRFGPNRYTASPLTANGWIGVDLFFVLSGYFIGTQLWRELSQSGTVSVGWFMVRRGLRIWPLYFFFFAAVTVAAPAWMADKQHGWSDLVFLTNYLNLGIVQGSWSLCTEEQFYLLAPAMLWMIGPRSMRAYRWGLAALLGLVCVVRALTYHRLTGQLLGKHPLAFKALYYPLHTHCDGLIAGMFVANLAFRFAGKHDRAKGLLARPVLMMGLTALLLVLLVAVRGECEEFAGLGIFFAAVVWWGVKTQTRLFSQHIFYLLSRLSFGMYLNHEYMEGWLLGHLLPWLGALRLGSVIASMLGAVLLTLCSMAGSAVTFCLVEHPFLMLRTALMRRRVVSPLVAH